MDKHSEIPMRQDTAKQYRNIRHILHGQEPEIDPPQKQPRNRYFIQAILFILSIVTIYLLLQGCAHAQEGYKNEQIVEAIGRAENSSKFPYGIKSVACTTTAQCRRICLLTVARNRVRFARFGHKNYPDFISFLGSRYCPSHGTALSFSERRLNQYWINNVRWFLNHPKKG